MDSERVIGEVIWFDPQRGYGYVKQGEGEKDMFVHFSNVVMDGFRTLYKGQLVEYTIGEGEEGNHKGPQAIQVVVVEDSRKDHDDGGE